MADGARQRGGMLAWPRPTGRCTACLPECAGPSTALPFTSLDVLRRVTSPASAARAAERHRGLNEIPEGKPAGWGSAALRMSARGWARALS